jgi:SAM-dependent methyltransferase
MMDRDQHQVLQESKYGYPYHYIAMWDGSRFSQTQSMVWGYEYLSYLFFVLEVVKSLEASSVLDIGCGDGRFLFELHRASPPGTRLVGLDYSERAIAYARIMAPDVKWVCGDVRDERALGEGPFDVVSLIETLEHIKPDEIPDFLMGVRRCLADDGTFVVTVPSDNVRVNRKHYQHFSPRSLTEALSPFFTVRDVRHLNHTPTRLLKLMRTLLNNRLFILNHRRLLRWIYIYYVEHYLIATERTCRRLAVVCKPRN